jgi:ABC-type sugar transport system permease subunit
MPVLQREGAVPWAFLAPSLLVLGALSVYPMVYAIVLSFQQGTFIDVGGWAGADNYREIFSDEVFRKALRFSVISTAATVAGSYALGLGIALAVHRA